MVLRIPASVVNNTHNANTFAPYDPNAALGDVSPTTPTPQAQGEGGGKCGTFGKILLAVVAVAVTIASGGIGGAIAGGLGFTGGAATVVGGAIAGALGSVVSQGVGLATGIQDKFSFKQVGLAAIGGGVGAGNIGGKLASDIGSKFASRVVAGAINSAVTQGIGVATGLQSKFSFAGVAAAGVGAGIGRAFGDKFGDTIGGAFGDSSLGQTVGSYAAQISESAVSAIANAATRSALDGSNFGDNIVAAIPDVIGQAVGGALGGQLARVIPQFEDNQPAKVVKTAENGGTEGGGFAQLISDLAGGISYAVNGVTSAFNLSQESADRTAAINNANFNRTVADAYIDDEVISYGSLANSASSAIRSAAYASIAAQNHTNGFFDRVSNDSFKVKGILDHRREAARAMAIHQAQNRKVPWEEARNYGLVQSQGGILKDALVEIWNSKDEAAKATWNVGVVDTLEFAANLGLVRSNPLNALTILNGGGADFSAIRFDVDPEWETAAAVGMMIAAPLSVVGKGGAFTQGAKLTGNLAGKYGRRAGQRADEAFNLIPVNTGKKTSGIFSYGNKSESLISGYKGPSANLPLGTPGMNGRIKSHVEAHTEPPRVCRRLFSLSYAATGHLSRLA